MITGEAGFATVADRNAGPGVDLRAIDDPELARLAAVVSVLDRLPGAGGPSPEFRARLRARLLDQAADDRPSPI